MDPRITFKGKNKMFSINSNLGESIHKLIYEKGYFVSWFALIRWRDENNYHPKKFSKTKISKEALSI